MTTYQITIGEEKYLLHERNGKCGSFGIPALRCKAQMSQNNSDTVCITKNYPIIFWTQSDFIENSMVRLFNDINKN